MHKTNFRIEELAAVFATGGGNEVSPRVTNRDLLDPPIP